MADQLTLLADAGIVEPVGLALGTYRFRHALMRDAAYETQVLDVRRETHAAVAEVLAAHGAEPALVAQHLDLAGAADGAAVRYLEAAQAEQGRGAHAEGTEVGLACASSCSTPCRGRTTATCGSSPPECCAGSASARCTATPRPRSRPTTGGPRRSRRGWDGRRCCPR